MNPFWIIISSLAAIIIISLVVILTTKPSSAKELKKCTKDSDCAEDKYCLDGECVAKREYTCNVSDLASDLTACHLDKDNCATFCTNFPTFSCVQVTKDNPYTFESDEGPKNVPIQPIEGQGWCLPAVDTSIKCSPVTADPILYKLGDENKYAWGCRCKYNFIKSTSSTGDCTIVDKDACSSGEIYVTDETACSPEKECENNGWCNEQKCYYSWKDRKDLDPTRAICRCDDGYLSQVNKLGSQNYTFNCVKDPCAPGTTTTGDGGKKTCTCPGGYVRCPEDAPDGTEAQTYYQSVGSRCIPQPCGEGGAWKVDSKICSCPTGKYQRGSDNIFGRECVDPCAGGKCYTGNTQRGDCTGISADDFRCDNCRSPWKQDPTGKCLTPCIPPDKSAVTASDCCSGKINLFYRTCL